MNSEKLKTILQTIKDSEINQKLSFNIVIGILKIKKIRDDWFDYKITISDPIIGFRESKNKTNFKFIEYDLMNYFIFITKVKNERQLQRIMRKIGKLSVNDKLELRIDFLNGFAKLFIGGKDNDLYAFKTEITEEGQGTGGIFGCIGSSPISHIENEISDIFNKYCKF